MATMIIDDIVKKYSDFVAYPIVRGETTLNSQKAIWDRPKAEVTDEVPLLVTVAPLVPAVTVNVPSVTASVTVMDPLPASASEMARPLFLRLRATCSVLE